MAQIATTSAAPVAPRRNYSSLIVGVLLILVFSPLIISIVLQIIAKPGLFLEQLKVGLVNGAIVAIIALGYTLVYGIIELINFAHGDVYMIGVFTALTTLSVTGTLDATSPGRIVLGLAFALVVAIVVCATLNATIERLAYRRLRNAPRLAPLISAIGMSFIIENIGLMWASQTWLVPSFGTTGGASQKSFPDL